MIEIRRKEAVYFGTGPDPADECAILRIAHERWGPRTHAVRADSRGQSVATVVAGEGGFAVHDRRWELRAGSVFCFGPGSPHEFWCRRPHSMEIYIVDFTGTSASTMVARSTGAPTRAVSPANPHLVVATAEHLFEVARTNQPFAHATCVHLLHALLLTVRAGLTSTLPRASASEASYFACKSCIDQGFRSMSSVSQAARAAHVSHAYMCRLFRRHGGVSPQEYLARLKMNHAAHLLLSSDLSVKEIARDLCYADQYVFSKCFKRLMGLAPCHYRDSYAAARSI